MTDVATQVTGGCLCGRIRYEAEVFLHNGYVCHCTICQRNSGQPAELTVLIRPGTLKYLKDEPQYYNSSPEGKRGFCALCGSRLVWQARRAEDDWLTNLTVGSLDRPAEARMTRHIYADTRLPWYDALEGLPTYAEADLPRLLQEWRDEVGGA